MDFHNTALYYEANSERKGLKTHKYTYLHTDLNTVAQKPMQINKYTLWQTKSMHTYSEHIHMKLVNMARTGTKVEIIATRDQ